LIAEQAVLNFRVLNQACDAAADGSTTGLARTPDKTEIHDYTLKAAIQTGDVGFVSLVAYGGLIGLPSGIEP